MGFKMAGMAIFAIVVLAAMMAPARSQPIASASFTPNRATISTSEGAPYADCDFWVKAPSACNNFSNFGYGPTKILRLYICLTGKVTFDACSRQPTVTGRLPAAMVHDIGTRIAAYSGTGIRLLIRFIYNFGPIGGSAQDAPVGVILGHLDQLAPVLLQNKDLIFALEAGFIGTWGEWHDSTNGNDSAAAHKAVLDEELAYFSGAFPILVREPGALITYTGTPIPQPALGIHDDYFASSRNDANTWAACLNAVGYCLANSTQSQLMAYGAAVSAASLLVGEFGAVYPALQTCAALDAYSARFHLQSIALTPYPASVGAELQRKGCAATFFNKVGTRIVLQRAFISGSASAGGTVTLALTMVNNGYGRVIRARPAKLLFIQNGHVAAAIPVPIGSLDLRTLAPNAPQTFTFSFPLPATLRPGSVSVALLIPDPAPSLAEQAAYALPLNSVDQNNLPLFNPINGYNALLTFPVSRVLEPRPSLRR